MKKCLSLLLCLIMALSIVTAGAESVSPKYATTKAFMDLLEKNNMRHECRGVQKSGNELVILYNHSDDYGDREYRFTFNESGTIATIQLWNLIDFAPEDRAAVMDVCNKANYDWKFTRFYVDDTDNSVTVQFDGVLPEDGSKTEDVVWMMVLRMHDIIKNVYPDLVKFDT